MVQMEYSPNGKDIMAPVEYIASLITSMKKAQFYEGFFFEVSMVMLKHKRKYIIKDTMSINISFIHYMK